MLVVVGLMAVALTGTAVAAPAIGKGGQISACYKVKGKAKGAMRVVPAGKKCKRGERKLAWSVSGPSGASGAAGSQGQPGGQGQAGAKGDQGQTGATGAPNTGEAALETKIVNLNLKIASLESVLNGVTNTALTETIAGLPLLETDLSDLNTTVSGLTTTVTGLTSNVKGVQEVLKDVTNTGLTEAVKVVPQVGSLCTQAQTLTTQSNLLGSSFGKIKVLSGLVELELPKVEALPGFAC